jgi:ElaB/YqjD/DUF883 family membrane-anchored ribosome-binding protein
MKTNVADKKNVAEDYISDFAEKAQDVASDVMSKAGDLASDAGDKVKEVAENVPKLIRQYPLQSLLIGCGIGFIAAMAISRFK